MRFTYYNPVKIHFGVDFREALKHIAQNEKKILLVSTKRWRKQEGEIEHILGAKLTQIIDEISPNPNLQHLQYLAQNLSDFDCIVAFGGGSVIDSAKFLSVKSDLQNGNLTIQSQSKHIYAFPTTSGTSSELTHWATVWDNDAFIKHSLSDEILYPKEAFYDPRLTLSLSREMTIYTALDALSHSFESIWNNNANPISTHYALCAIEIILRDLPTLAENLHSLELRTNLMQASMQAGLAFSNTQTALAHALSYPLTMRFGTPHGLACSFSLPLLLDCLPKQSHAYALLSPFRARLLEVFDKLEISPNPKEYGLDSAFINEIFASLNARAKNGIFDIECVKTAFCEALLG